MSALREKMRCLDMVAFSKKHSEIAEGLKFKLFDEQMILGLSRKSIVLHQAVFRSSSTIRW